MEKSLERGRELCRGKAFETEGTASTEEDSSGIFMAQQGGQCSWSRVNQGDSGERQAQRGTEGVLII